MANDIGTIEPYKAADLVALDGEPTRDISAVSRVKAVSQGSNRIVQEIPLRDVKIIAVQPYGVENPPPFLGGTW
ncbi:uncharacterized protein METZ01_LOCUS304605 [marine metagenome]|uniref:Amidohydrolase-related domain-containing protein n=1 Tax=marine metagenome TaxID=408172 RepID=A0A382MWP0_9ZZZZ